jgi:hypothetical protein
MVASDDRRTLLSYKLPKCLHFNSANVLTTDPYVAEPNLTPREEVLDEADPFAIRAFREFYSDVDFNGLGAIYILSANGRGTVV